MPKSTGIPKSILADIGRLKTKLASLEKDHVSLMGEFKTSNKAHANALRNLEQTLAKVGKKAAKREKRKPSAYNLFLKDKMSQGMSMVEAVKAWKEKQGGMPTSTRTATQEWQQPGQQY